MIITVIEQIDSLAAELLAQPAGLISVDMNDYAFIKNSSKALKAIKFETKELDVKVGSLLKDALSEAGEGSIENILFYISGNGASLSMAQIQECLSPVQNHAPNANIVWGIGEGEKGKEGVTIFIVVGYDN